MLPWKKFVVLICKQTRWKKFRHIRSNEGRICNECRAIVFTVRFLHSFPERLGLKELKKNRKMNMGVPVISGFSQMETSIAWVNQRCSSLVLASPQGFIEGCPYSYGKQHPEPFSQTIHFQRDTSKLSSLIDKSLWEEDLTFIFSFQFVPHLTSRALQWYRIQLLILAHLCPWAEIYIFNSL